MGGLIFLLCLLGASEGVSGTETLASKSTVHNRTIEFLSSQNTTLGSNITGKSSIVSNYSEEADNASEAVPNANINLHQNENTTDEANFSAKNDSENQKATGESVAEENKVQTSNISKSGAKDEQLSKRNETSKSLENSINETNATKLNSSLWSRKGNAIQPIISGDIDFVSANSSSNQSQAVIPPGPPSVITPEKSNEPHLEIAQNLASNKKNDASVPAQPIEASLNQTLPPLANSTIPTQNSSNHQEKTAAHLEATNQITLVRTKEIVEGNNASHIQPTSEINKDSQTPIPSSNQNFSNKISISQTEVLSNNNNATRAEEHLENQNATPTEILKEETNATEFDIPLETPVTTQTEDHLDTHNATQTEIPKEDTNVSNTDTPSETSVVKQIEAHSESYNTTQTTKYQEETNGTKAEIPSETSVAQSTTYKEETNPTKEDTPFITHNNSQTEHPSITSSISDKTTFTEKSNIHIVATPPPRTPFPSTSPITEQSSESKGVFNEMPPSSSTLIPIPSVVNIEPSSGPSSGGTLVTVTLKTPISQSTSNIYVRFGTSIVVASSSNGTSVVCTSPGHISSIVQVSVSFDRIHWSTDSAPFKFSDGSSALAFLSTRHFILFAAIIAAAVGAFFFYRKKGSEASEDNVVSPLVVAAPAERQDEEVLTSSMKPKKRQHID